LDDGKKVADGPVATVVGDSQIGGAAALESLFFGAGAERATRGSGVAPDAITTSEPPLETPR